MNITTPNPQIRDVFPILEQGSFELSELIIEPNIINPILNINRHII